MNATDGQFVHVTAADGHALRTYVSEPAGPARGAVLVFQEIFGVNHHIRSVTERIAAEGYRGLAPDLFARGGRDIELGYEAADGAEGRRIRMAIPLEATMADIAATLALARQTGPVAVMGFCWGGSLAYLSACRLAGLSAAIGYYGGMIGDHIDEKPQCPIELHFGRNDPHIALTGVARIQQAYPTMPIHLYEAGHGFHCDERKDFHPPSAALAWQRSMTFLNKHMHS